jgi:hypothetical protein
VPRVYFRTHVSMIFSTLPPPWKTLSTYGTFQFAMPKVS